MYNISDIHVNEERAQHTLFFLHNLLNGFGLVELSDSQLKRSLAHPDQYLGGKHKANDQYQGEGATNVRHQWILRTIIDRKAT